MQIRGVLAPCVILLMAAAPAAVLAQRNNNQRQQQQQKTPQRSPQEQRDIDALFFAVDGVAAGQTAPTDIPVTWDVNYFIQSTNGQVYVPFVVKVDRSKLASTNVALYVRLVDKNAPAPAAPAAPAPADKKDAAPVPPPAPSYAWSLIHFVDVPADGVIARAVQVPPGDYTMYVAVKEKNTEKIDPKAPPAPAAAATPVKAGILQRDLTVPDYATAGLSTSSVLVANAVEPVNPPLPPDQQDANPLVIGGMMRVVPQVDHRFSKAGELIVMYWIYGAAANAGKPDLQVEYTVFQGEKPIAKTPVDVVNATTLPADFNLASSQGVNRIQPIPMASFPAGDYRLEIKITDKAADNKVVTQNVNFTVLPV